MTKKNSTATDRPKYTKDLILLFAIPLSIGLIAVLSIYVPRLFAHPKYDFIYSYCETYSCDLEYTIKDNQVSQLQDKNSQSTYDIRGTEQKLGYYDASTGGTRVLSYEEARTYELLNSSKSPDGYSLSRQDSENGFLFWGSSDRSWILKNGLKQKPVELNGTRDSYSDDITLLGWIQ